MCKAADVAQPPFTQMSPRAPSGVGLGVDCRVLCEAVCLTARLALLRIEPEAHEGVRRTDDFIAIAVEELDVLFKRGVSEKPSRESAHETKRKHSTSAYLLKDRIVAAAARAEVRLLFGDRRVGARHAYCSVDGSRE